MTSSDLRFARLAELPTIGPAGLARLHASTVAVIGVGNVGGQVARHLALLGVRLVLVDYDRVEAQNLATQGFTEDQVGLPKVEAATRWLGPLNPGRIEPRHADIRRFPLGALRDTSLLFSCVDGSSRVAINEIAVRLGIPWIDGALDGSGASSFARVAAYNPRLGPRAACYLCPHDATSLRRLMTETRADGCAARWWQPAGNAAPATVATSALGGAVAGIEVLWGLSLLLGDASEIAGREMYFDAASGHLSKHRLRPNPRCLFDHRAYSLTTLEGGRSKPVTRTFDHAEAALAGDVVLHVERRSIVTSLHCPACGAERRPYRTVDTVPAREIACDCGVEMQPLATDVVDRFSRGEAAGFLQRTWADIGIEPGDVVVASRGDRELHLLLDA